MSNISLGELALLVPVSLLMIVFMAHVGRDCYEDFKGIKRCPYCGNIYKSIGDCGCIDAMRWQKMIESFKQP